MTMRVNSQISFKGYDARPIKGFLMSTNCRGIADEMQQIGQKEGFDIFSFIDDEQGGRCKKAVPPHTKGFSWAWAQDYWTIANKKLFTREPDCIADSIKDFFNLNFDKTQTKVRKDFLKANKDSDFTDMFLKASHISGGNLFIVKDKDSDIALIGEDDLKKYSVENIKKMYGVSKVIPLPQVDYHLDLFIRPLDNKRVLLSDDNMTLKLLDEISNDLKNYPAAKCMTELFKNNFKSDSAKNVYFPKTEEVEKILKDNGFEVIKVPGSAYYVLESEFKTTHDIHYDFNFMNANVFVNPDGELVYITNKSDMDEKLELTSKIKKQIGGGFEHYFKKAISPYIKPEHVYFVDGEDNFVSKKLLEKFFGGIHCACSEIPAEI